MIGLGKSRLANSANVLHAIVQSWDVRGGDETAVCASALDLMRSYLGERPCCVWKKVDSGLSKICERGMVEVFLKPEGAGHQQSLTRALVGGTTEFDACHLTSIDTDLRQGYDGFLHVPIKIQDDMLGILSLAASKKEARDRDFVQPLESVARLIAISLKTIRQQEETEDREKHLRAEVTAATRELELTNRRLIERVRELKMLYNELHKRVQELTQANRAKDEFLSVVSHELRTPLTSITGFLAVLLDEEAGSITEQQKKFLSIAKQSALRLNLIISDLLDISRIESGRLNLNMGVCSMVEVIKQSVETIRKTAEAKGVTLDLGPLVNIPPAWGDSSRLQQVVDNLIANAVKFTDKGGRVDVAASEKGDFIHVSVKDTGPGLTPDEQEKVFDMFYQADSSIRRASGGVGLGLAIARGIVQMHGGQIKVESEKGQGSTFYFIIPRCKAQRAA